MPEADERPASTSRVVVTDVDIKFQTMVWLFVKASFAAAIAAVITSVLWAAVAVLLMALTWLGFMVVMTVIAALGFGGAMMVGPTTPLPPAPTDAVPIEAPADLAPAEVLDEDLNSPAVEPAPVAPTSSKPAPRRASDEEVAELTARGTSYCTTFGASSAECTFWVDKLNGALASRGEPEVEFGPAPAPAPVIDPAMVASSFEAVQQALANNPASTAALADEPSDAAALQARLDACNAKKRACVLSKKSESCVAASARITELDAAHPSVRGYYCEP